ncbi:MAG: divalent metal cation transporter [Pirellulales bacterium]
MSDPTDRIEANRQLLVQAQEKGGGATLAAYFRLSGPGWLQSAITLGGGSLAGALFIGALGGVEMLWLQLLAIIMGVIMLSAISYVTLSTGQRPFNAINQHINPALGWGWLIATSLANMIWCMPQFSLCFGALSKNLVPGTIGESMGSKIAVSAAILVAVTCIVVLNARGGSAAKAFDWMLKALVGLVVICFFGAVFVLSTQGVLNWGEIFAGFIPDFGQWTSPSGRVAELIKGLPDSEQAFWTEGVVRQQRARMIGAAATAVGINMTFLMPYAILQRGWDKPFRGLARFDLMTGMAIPYILVTSCVVIASAHAFHGKADKEFLSADPNVFQKSDTFNGAKDRLMALVSPDIKEKKFDKAVANMSEDGKQKLVGKMAAVSKEEKQIAASMVQRNAASLSKTLSPFIGDKFANFAFGLGVFGMGFSTIIILMLINGFVFREAVGKPDSTAPYVLGCLIAGIVGAAWPLVWDGDSKFWLAIVASSFGMMLLPIAYITFFMMMNSRSLMGDEKPTGVRMTCWNVLMGVSVIGAIAAAATAIYDKITDTKNELAAQGGKVVLGMLVVYVIIVVVGFVRNKKPSSN